MTLPNAGGGASGSVVGLGPGALCSRHPCPRTSPPSRAEVSETCPRLNCSRGECPLAYHAWF